jgi:NAD(P)-dependent dehydrogenase (short-subunit alcohol dehydrogenase family)
MTSEHPDGDRTRDRPRGTVEHRKSIFITGAASGIGHAIAAYFSRQGWRVGLSDINQKQLIDAFWPLGTPYLLDVRDRAAWDATLAEFAGPNHGRIDVVVNNAGIGVGGALVGLTEPDVDRTIQVNFHGTVNGARAAYPYLKAAGPGSCLLNIASASAIYGAAGLALYSATKFGVRGLTEALDLEWEADGIKCRSLMPAFVDTPMMAQPAQPGSSDLKRDRVLAAKLEFTPVDDVAQAAWKAIHGINTHTLVGTSAKQLHLAARWAPSLLRRKLRSLSRAAAAR